MTVQIQLSVKYILPISKITPKGHSGLDPESVYPILFPKRILNQVQDDRYCLGALFRIIIKYYYCHLTPGNETSA